MRFRELESVSDFRAAERLQHEVWGFDPVEVVPLHLLITAQENGGALLGAFDGDALAGFGFGFLGRGAGRGLKLCSHLLAVHPAYQGRGLGTALKWRQREWALSRGLDAVTWTFDPLEHRNARLNLRRLGGVADTYHVDLYGELRDELNAGMPTDRLEVTWLLRSGRVARRAGAEEGARRAGAEEEGRRAPDPVDAPPADAPLLNPGPDGGSAGPPAEPEPRDEAWLRVRVPRDVQRLKREDAEAALAWRRHLREALRSSFRRGYLLVDAGDHEGEACLWLARGRVEGGEIALEP